MAQDGTRRKKSRPGVWQRESQHQNTIDGKQEVKRRKSIANPRDCMAKAFQVHLQKIVENLIVCDSELPDVMISNGSLTEDECCYIRGRPNRKDQIRSLMVIIRGRSLKNMESLLKYIENDYNDLAKEIHNCYKDLLNQGYRDKDCLRCKLKTDVDVKSIADCLHTKDAISRRLYNEIVMTDAPIGGQDKLWDKLLIGIESNLNPKKAFNYLKSCLSEKGHYVHLADDLDHFLVDGCKMMECMCNIQLRPQTVCSTKHSNTDSADPHSSDSLGSTNSVEYRSRLFESVDPRPKAMYFPPSILAEENVMEGSADVELRPREGRRNTNRPRGLYVPQQREGQFLAEMIIEADPRITNV